MAEIASHFNLSFEQTVKLARLRMYLAIRAGEFYRGLEDEQRRGLKRGPLLPEVTTETARQQAEEGVLFGSEKLKVLAEFLRQSRG